MGKTVLRSSVMMVIALGLYWPAAALVPAAGTDPAGSTADLAGTANTGPEGLLNQDGTLRLDGNFSGTLNLSGWDVQIDPERGPVFDAAQPQSDGTSAMATAGNWADLGGGGGGALNHPVRAMAVMGTDVYVGGSFIDADDIPDADNLARWDGSDWSAVGTGSQGNGPLYVGGVSALAVSGTKLYAGGSFPDARNGGSWLPQAGYIAMWDGSNWSALGYGATTNAPSLNNSVVAIAVSGSNVYVGGYFVDVNNKGTSLQAADYVAKWDGAEWSALGYGATPNDPSLNSAVMAIAVSGSSVYVGGSFVDVNNKGAALTAAHYIAKWDGLDWSALGYGATPNDPSLSASVQAMAMSGSNLYVGGSFDTVYSNGTLVDAADFIARWDGANWWALGHGATANEGSINHAVLAIAVDAAGSVYAGGQFSDVRNGGSVLTAADRIAKWDPVAMNWSALGGNPSGNGSISNNVVQAIAVGATQVYAGGTFVGVQNASTSFDYAAYAASWDGASWAAMGSPQGSVTAIVYAVAVSGTDVYVGGVFENVSNHGTALPAADYIAKWDGEDWSALGATSTGDGAIPASVFAIAVSGSDVYAGGSFSRVWSGAGYIYTAKNIAKWDGTQWSAFGSDGGTGGSLNATVLAIAVAGSDVYVGGYFTDVNNGGDIVLAADFVAKWDGTDWSALGQGATASVGSLNNAVEALAVSGPDVYVGGRFTDVKDGASSLTAADYVAKWDGAHWSALGSNGPPGDGSLTNAVHALALSGSNLYVGGSFTNVSNYGSVLDAADYIAKWDGAQWSALGSDGADGGSLLGSIYALAVQGSNVYAGGRFTDVKNNGQVLTAADHLAMWDGSRWWAVGSGSGVSGSLESPPNAYVNALAVGASELYVGGNLYNVNNRGSVLPYADYIASYGYASAGWAGNPWYGSVSISSDRNVVAVGRPHVGAEVATYNGFALGSPTSYLPMLFKNAFGGSYNSAFYIQNVNPVAGHVAHVTIDYYDSTGTLTCGGIADTISPLASKGYWLSAVECLPVGWVGGAVVHSSDWGIVTVGRPHVGTEVMTYNGFNGGGLDSYLPMLFKNAFDGSYNSAFYIQNVDPTPGHLAHVTIDYYDSAGSPTCTGIADTIPAMASKGYWVPAENCLPAGWVGSAVITSSDYPIVAVGRPHVGSQVTSYNGFGYGSGSSYVPMLFKNAFGGSYNSAFYIQNVADAHVILTVSYYDSTGIRTCDPLLYEMEAGASMGLWVPAEHCLPAGWVGGAVVLANGPIVVVGRPHIGAQVTTYAGFTGGDTTMNLPMLFKNMWGSYNSAFYIQNTDFYGPAAVTVKFYDVDGNLSCSRVDSIPARATLGYWVPSVTCSP